MTALKTPWIVLCVATLAVAQLAAQPAPPQAAGPQAVPEAVSSPISQAETLLFVRDDLRSLPDGCVLHYLFSHRAAGEPPTTDRIEVTVSGAPGSAARKLSTHCFSGERAVDFESVGGADGNPALVCFLEHDVRLTRALVQRGTPNYFRQRVRLALAERADIKPIKAKFGGKLVPAEEIRITPFVDDPHRAEFERYASKSYVFRVSQHVPGGLLEVHTAIDDPARPGGASLLEESVRLLKVVRVP